MIFKKRLGKPSAYTNWQWRLHAGAALQGMPERVFVKIKGGTHYRWRAVDHEGEILEILATKRRDRQASDTFRRREWAIEIMLRNSSFSGELLIKSGRTLFMRMLSGAYLSAKSLVNAAKPARITPPAGKADDGTAALFFAGSVGSSSPDLSPAHMIVCACRPIPRRVCPDKSLRDLRKNTWPIH